jgi:hypothetical protein
MFKIRTYLLWFALTAVHTYLFYHHEIGVNALLFSAFTIGLITLYHGLQSEKLWWMAAGGHLISALAVSLHSYFSSTATYNLSFYILAGYVISVRSSLPVAFINGMYRSLFYTFVITVYSGICDLLDFIFKSEKAVFSFKRTSLYIAPISVTVVFYILYGLANPDFFLSVTFLEWDFNLELIFYILFGSAIICPLLFSGPIGKLAEWDLEKPDVLSRLRVKREKFAAMGLLYENKQGVIMFIMLNTLIAIFLGFSILQIFVPSLNHSPAGHSDQVHQGFEVLVISILVAILLIMYYFRANQNFYGRKEKLVKLATIWIGLNGILILFTCYKNSLYIDAFGLTYKRIWVFIGMLLTGLGLYLTLIKIYKVKTNWYLLRQNAWVLYFVIASYGLVDWDRLITWYNPHYAQFLDMNYILSLGDTKVPHLYELLEARDARVMPHEEEIKERMKNMKMPTSWQSGTADSKWVLRKYKR